MTGESYAGKYVPWFSNYLIEQGLNIKGVSIGNGWVAPQIQTSYIAEFALESNLITNTTYKNV
jgi:carboxypeptidase C (cathepsin A)